MVVSRSISVALLLGILSLSPYFSSPVQSIRVDNRIVNGQETTHYPHHVYVSYENALGGGFFGAGSIISATHVLTVAQIVHGFVTWNVGYGSNHFSLLSWTRTERSLVHPNYNLDSRENDIALLFLSTPFLWSPEVQPITLPPSNPSLPLANEQGTILGFGWTSGTGGGGGGHSERLHVAYVRVIPDAECQNVIAVSFPNHFCAADSVVPANICQGDLGGGFLTHYRSRLILVGLNSVLLEGCNYVWPSAYLRVHPYLAWIRKEAELE